MRLFLIILILGTTSFAYSQQTNEFFINQVDTAVVDKTAKSYFLYELLSDFAMVKLLNPGLKDELKKVLPDSVINFLLENIDAKNESIYWKKGIVSRADLVNQSTTDTLLGNIPVPKIDADATAESRKAEKVLKARRGKVFFFSKPIFDRQGAHALIQMGYACGSACGRTCIYVFKLIDGNWKKILQTGCTLS